MKITKIEVVHIKVPLKKPYNLSKAYGTLRTTEPIVVKMYTDEGFMGIGETDPMSMFTGENPETVKVVIKNYLGPAIIGAEPVNIAKIHEKMDCIVKDNYLAKAAIDMACYDIMGKVTDFPVHTLLGGKLRKRIPIMGALGSDKPENNAKEALEIKKSGYSSIMIKVGALDVLADAERVKAVREAVGDGFPLIVDANQGWDSGTAIKFVRLVEKYNIALLEQPVPYWDIDGMARVRKSIDIPVSADESLFSIHDAARLIREKAADLFSIKVAKHGGIYKAKQIMDLADAFGIPCMMNSMIEEGITQAASLQLGASARNLWGVGHAYSSPTRLEDDISDYSDQIIDGNVEVNEKPGLGIRIIEEKLERYKIDEFTV
ncbi:MAG: hypothetical protein HPY66_2467 [Firmicutes bacterium]|nr:hypothetical protein [Bacillota bacterium]